MDLTYYDSHETQESGVLTLSLFPKCFWQGRTGGWTVSQASTPDPRTAASLINSSQTLTPSRSGQSFAQKGLLPHVTPHHHLTTPHLLSSSQLPNDTDHPCPEESQPGEQEAGQHGKGNRGGEHTTTSQGPGWPTVRFRAAGAPWLRGPVSRATWQTRTAQGLRSTGGQNHEAQVQLTVLLQLHGGSQRLLEAC